VCRKEALWLLNLVLKVVEQSPMYDWLELFTHLVTVAWYIMSLYEHLPFNEQWEGSLQLHCVSFGLVVVVGMCAVLGLCWFKPLIMFFMLGMHNNNFLYVFLLKILLSWLNGGKNLSII